MKGDKIFGFYIKGLGELLLSKYSEELANLQYQNGRANLDLPLQKFIKNVIIQNKYYKVDGYDDWKVINIYTENEYTDNIKNQVENYNNPDMIFEVHLGGDKKYEKLELKTSKDICIKGSSLSNIDNYEQTIFIYRGKDGIDIATGEYYKAITDMVPRITDRQPRLYLSFSKLKKAMNEDIEIPVNNNYIYDAIADKTINELIKTPVGEYDWYSKYNAQLLCKFLNLYENLDEKAKLDVKKKLYLNI